MAIKKFKESDDDDYVSEMSFLILSGQKNGFKRDQNFEAAQARPHCRSVRGVQGRQPYIFGV